MSKSTPLSQLSSQDTPINTEMSGGNAFDEKENQLVAEILTEINNEAGDETNNILMELNDPVSNTEPPKYSPPEQEQEREPEPSREQLSKEFSLDEDENSGENSLQSVQDEILSRIKLPLLAGALVVLFCTPQVSNVISKLVPPKEFFQNHKNLFVLVAKFILSSITFTAVQFAV
jgi:hypothetical protein